MPSLPPASNTSRRRTGVVVGLLGFVVGVVAFAASIPALGLAAGLLALVAPTLVLNRVEEPRTQVAPQEQRDEPTIADIPMPETSPFHEIDGLLTGDFFEVAVQTRITAARRFLKPLAVVRLRVVSTEENSRAEDSEVAKAIIAQLRDCDTACALSTDSLGLVLEDTPENGAIWAVERIRRGLATDFPAVRVWAGVACYPAHAMDADEVMSQAEEALDRAQEWPQDRIEVAFAE